MLTSLILETASQSPRVSKGQVVHLKSTRCCFLSPSPVAGELRLGEEQAGGPAGGALGVSHRVRAGKEGRQRP